MSRSEEISRGLVRIWDNAGRTRGVGFLISDRLILTCAHVAARALGVAEPDLSSSKEPLAVDFALIDDAARHQVMARVVPLPADLHTGSVLSDVAILMLDNAPPNKAAPLKLSRDRDVEQHAISTFGFPSVSPDDNGDWADGIVVGLGSAELLQIRSASRQGRRVQRGFSGAPVWDNEMGCVIGMVTKADLVGDDRVSYAIPSWNLALAVAGFVKPPPCPYRGLESFDEDHSLFFFGRDDFVARLVSRVGERSMLAVVGSSGVGKSSVVAAGLASEFKKRDDWRVARVRRPGEDPFGELALAIMPLVEPNLTKFEQQIRAPALAGLMRDKGLAACLAAAPDEDPYSLLLIIDQFEDLFVLDNGDSKRFIHVITRAAGRRPGHEQRRLYIVLAMRTEFLKEAVDHYPELADAMNPVEILGSMTADQLRSAIEEPVRNSGIGFADGLVDRILADTPDRVQLPLVEFLLTSLWEHQDKAYLTHPAYQDLGGVGGALANHAEQVFAGLNRPEQDKAETLFMRLVAVSGGDAPVTSRVAGRKEFDSSEWLLVQHFADQRLLLTATDPTGDQTVQIIHEALISKWNRLADWIAENRRNLILETELRDAARRWITRDRDSAWLLRGRALSEAVAWASDPQGSTDPQTMVLVAASLIADADGTPNLETSAKAVEISERTDDVALRVVSLAIAISTRLARFEPFTAFGYWRGLWQYENMMREPDNISARREWYRAANSIWEMLVQAFSLIGIWLLGWFGSAFLVGDSIKYHHYGEATSQVASLIVVTIILRCAGRAFRHGVLLLPPLLAASALTIMPPFVKKPELASSMTGSGWKTITIVIPVVVFLTFLIWVLRRYRLASVSAREPLGSRQ